VTRFRSFAISLALSACDHANPVVVLPDTPVDADPHCFLGQPGDLLGSACVPSPIERGFGGDMTVDTNMGSPICEADFKAAYCMISGTKVTIQAGARIVATGERPLLIVAYDTIDVEGTVDVSSHRAPAEVIGASADDARCQPAAGGSDTVGGSGGAGGSLSFFGGAGGAAGATAGPQPLPGPTPVALHGGCIGGPGGAFGMALGGAVGHSGGAVYLIAQSSITLGAGARLLANGEGGGKGSPGAGGGGGGSGGMIVLDAPMIALATGALVLAEGGGGGGGGDLGNLASDGGEVDSAPGASGGSATAPAGAGGGGATASAGINGHDNATTSTGGAGGGGGASGAVLIYGARSGTALISPPAP
jgi:hypothetical protein